jgi:NTP pyrophosphatase (non-canonical NTP hydrolase)
MGNLSLDEIIDRSVAVRNKYHDLERAHHGSEWTVEEDALAYLTDAALVGRDIMSQQRRWPKTGSQEELEHKLGENIWWLIVLANRSDIDIKKAVQKFLKKTESLLK